MPQDWRDRQIRCPPRRAVAADKCRAATGSCCCAPPVGPRSSFAAGVKCRRSARSDRRRPIRTTSSRRSPKAAAPDRPADRGGRRPAHRRSAAGRFRQFGEQRLVERLAHAVEPLEFKTFDAAGVLDNAGDRQRVVGGELREQAVARREQPLHASHVAEVGHRLAGEHRIVGKPALLGALEFGCPNTRP